MQNPRKISENESEIPEHTEKQMLTTQIIYWKLEVHPKFCVAFVNKELTQTQLNNRIRKHKTSDA